MRRSLRHDLHIIRRKTLREAATRYRDLEAPLNVVSQRKKGFVTELDGYSEELCQWGFSQSMDGVQRQGQIDIVVSSQRSTTDLSVYTSGMCSRTLNTTGGNGSNEYGN
jgi:hypothetical protein